VQAALVRLLGSVPGVAQVVAQNDPLPAFDVHCPMLSMPLALGTTSIAAIPGAVPYLHAEAAKVAAWGARLAGMETEAVAAGMGAGATGAAGMDAGAMDAAEMDAGAMGAAHDPTGDGGDAVGKPGVQVGLVWAGNPRKHLPTGVALDRRRSIALERLAPLFSLRGPRFFSLQKDGPAAPGHFPLTDFMGEIGDFADTAALVANLDLVISVDTSVAHLAAALGKPVWLLDRFDPCWRWLVGRRDSPWYPTLRIYRQPQPGDWDAVLAEVARDLRGFAGVGG
jgi:hypothetical protein